MMSGWGMALTDSEASAATAAQITVPLSFDEAFTVHHRAVYRYACALVRDPQLAEDIVQEVFLRLYQNLDTAQREGLLRAWLLRVAANVARNMLRGKNRSAARDDEFAAELVRVVDASSVDDELVRQSEIQEARLVLGRIKEPMRSCLLLKHEGLSYREIAAALEINEANVGSLIARGRREFLRLYGKIGGERP
jgi:RNA polymerase sigma-70 factor (ECF subfamily)